MIKKFINSIKKRRSVALIRCLANPHTVVLTFYFRVGDFLTSFRSYLYNNCITNFPSNSIRIFYLKRFLGIKIGKFNFIHMGCRFEGKIIIGNNNVLGRNCTLIGDITIKDNVSITAETYIFTASHIVDDPDFRCFYKPVVIEDYAWIGARAMILPGVKIGKGAILGAASTATKDIPDFHVFAGTPAKKIGERNVNLTYRLKYFPFFQ